MIMKKIFCLLIILLLAINSFTQISLTYKNNALLAGDSTIYNEISYISPGEEGANRIWDFSKIKYSEKNISSRMNSFDLQNRKDFGDYNVVVNEGKNTFYYNVNENMFEEKGYCIIDNSIIYYDPIVKMKYPFSYGDKINDTFSGIVNYPANGSNSLNGEYSVVADAYGALILPDCYLKNVLRIKIEKKVIESNFCSSAESHIIRYFWYAPDMRYPVLSTGIIEFQRDGQKPDVTYSTLFNIQRKTNNNLVSDPNENSDIPIMLFPSPFSDKLNYNYFLRKLMPVNIDLYDVSGKYNISLVKNQLQQEGLHTNELDADYYKLTPGVYYIRFTFDKKVVINKIVKI